MDQIALMKELKQQADSKLVLVVFDGLGGLPTEPGGKTSLEAAYTPNLDRLAELSICGLSTPILPGITPGSGPAHLALFGYDPLYYEIGRGVLEALGIGFDLQQDDVAARGNFCTLDPKTGLIIDRRAGRISSDVGKKMVDLLRGITLTGVEVFVEPVKEYRFVLIMRGPGLADGLTETDPQKAGKPPLPIKPLKPEAEKTAKLFNEWMEKARHTLKDQWPANGCNLRGLAKDPGLPSFFEAYGLKAGAIATYPMYRGVAKLVGMDILPAGDTLESELECLQTHWNQYDFFFFHIKKTDSAGEDGNFQKKVEVIEEADTIIPRILALKPDVLCITGDHSTPAPLKSHSWHELPLLLHAGNIRCDNVKSFGERPSMAGGIGHIRHVDIMPLMMAHGMRLQKFGA
jgi:2,3-bisphosphoglycerate-independent phosphoglycerate mutase